MGSQIAADFACHQPFANTWLHFVEKMILSSSEQRPETMLSNL